jgi:hypothetical protein
MGIHENRQKVLAWLKAQGYKIGKTKLYRDADDGLLILEPDGSVRQESVDRYIKVAGLKQPAAQTVEASILADGKAAEEIKNYRLKNAKLEHELAVLHGKYVLKTEAESNEADIAALLDALPRHILMLNLPRYLGAIGADTTKARMFFELFDADFTRAVNQICDDGKVELLAGEDPLIKGDQDAV